MPTQLSLNRDDDNYVNTYNAHRVLLAKGEKRWTLDGHTITKDPSGLWWTDPYGLDCGLFEISRQGVKHLVLAIQSWKDPHVSRASAAPG